MELAGLGGAASLSFCCTKCGSCNVKFETSSLTEKGDAAVSKILQVATICSGTSYAIYKMFHHVLGMHTVSDSVFKRDVSTCEGHFRWHLLGSQKGSAGGELLLVVMLFGWLEAVSAETVHTLSKIT